MTRSTCVDCGAPLTTFALRCRRCSGGAPAAAPPPPPAPVVHRDVKPEKAPKVTAAPCPGCGGVVPPSYGPRPRIHCSSVCRSRTLNRECKDRKRKTQPRRPCATPGCTNLAREHTVGRPPIFCSPACRPEKPGSSTPAPAAPPKPIPDLLALARDAIAWGRAVLEAHGETA